MSLFKKIAIFSLIFSLFAPFAAAQNSSFDTYQRVKNVTAEDSSAGSSITLGRPGDEIRHLVFVYNTDNREHTYTIKGTLPTLLTLDPSTTERRIDDAWKKSPEITKEITMRLHPFEHAYHRFTTHLANNLPNENLILITAISVTDDESQTETTSTKVYIPYFNPTKALSDNYQNVTKTDETKVKKALDEERKFMEAEFAKLITNENREQKSSPAIIDESTGKNQNWSYYLIFFGLIFTAILIYQFIEKKQKR
jgi:hypothetical protein